MSEPIRIGQGKYDTECEAIQKTTQANAVLLMVVGGELGSGFSFVGTAEMLGKIPTILRVMADELEDQYRTAAGN